MSTTIAAVVAGALDDEGRARLADLFDEHHPLLYRLALRMARNPEEARDLLQETFLRAGRSLRTLPSGDEAIRFLIRILTNLCRDQHRRSVVRTAFQSVFTRTRSEDPREQLIASATVHSVIGQLPPRQKMIVILHELEERSLVEIAVLLGVRPATARWHLFEARRKLAVALEPRAQEKKP